MRGIDDGLSEFEGLPVASTLQVEHGDRYGSVPGLDDEELADPGELERVRLLMDFEPILALPVKRQHGWSIRPSIDENGNPDWGAFGSIDWDRIAGPFNRARYKADELEEELEGVLIILSVTKHRQPRPAMDLVLKKLRMGVIAVEHIADDKMQVFARLYLRAWRLKREIADLRGVGGPCRVAGRKVN